MFTDLLVSLLYLPLPSNNFLTSHNNNNNRIKSPPPPRTPPPRASATTGASARRHGRDGKEAYAEADALELKGGGVQPGRGWRCGGQCRDGLTHWGEVGAACSRMSWCRTPGLWPSSPTIPPPAPPPINPLPDITGHGHQCELHRHLHGPRLGRHRASIQWEMVPQAQRDVTGGV